MSGLWEPTCSVFGVSYSTSVLENRTPLVTQRRANTHNPTPMRGTKKNPQRMETLTTALWREYVAEKGVPPVGGGASHTPVGSLVCVGDAVGATVGKADGIGVGNGEGRSDVRTHSSQA
jgi:hypothetical protein